MANMIPTIHRGIIDFSIIFIFLHFLTIYSYPRNPTIPDSKLSPGVESGLVYELNINRLFLLILFFDITYLIH